MNFDLSKFRAGMQNVGQQVTDFSDKYHDQIVGTLAGTAVGGGIGALATDTTDDETMGAKSMHRFRNALTGAAAGGAAGLSGVTAQKRWFPSPTPAPAPGVLAKGFDMLRQSKPIAGLKNEIEQGTGHTAKELMVPLNGSDPSQLAVNAAEGAIVGKGAQSVYDRWMGTRGKNLAAAIENYKARSGSLPATSATAPSGFPGFNNEEHLKRLMAAEGAVNSGASVRSATKGMRIKGKSKMGLLIQALSMAGLPAASYFLGKEKQ